MLTAFENYSMMLCSQCSFENLIKMCLIYFICFFNIYYVISTLKLNRWSTNLVFSQLNEYPISLNCYKDIYGVGKL